MFQGWVRKRIWLQVIVGIGAIALNMLPVSSDIFKVDSLCKYFIFFYAGFLIQIYFEIFPEWKKILDNTGVLIIGCLAWGMVFVAGNTLFDLAGAFGTARYVLMKAKVLRVLCGEK